MTSWTIEFKSLNPDHLKNHSDTVHRLRLPGTSFSNRARAQTSGATPGSVIGIGLMRGCGSTRRGERDSVDGGWTSLVPGGEGCLAER